MKWINGLFAALGFELTLKAKLGGANQFLAITGGTRDGDLEIMVILDRSNGVAGKQTSLGFAITINFEWFGKLFKKILGKNPFSGPIFSNIVVPLEHSSN